MRIVPFASRVGSRIAFNTCDTCVFRESHTALAKSRKLGANEIEIMGVLADRAHKTWRERIHALGFNRQCDLDIRPNTRKVRDNLIYDFCNLGRTA